MKQTFVILLLSAVFGCTAEDSPLRIGILEWPPYEIARLAQDLGYLGDGNFVFVEFQSPAEAARAYSVGGLDIVALTSHYLVPLAEQDPETQAFLIIDESLGGDSVISRQPIGNLADIAGRRIGLESSELGAHILSRLLDHANLAVEDIDIVFVDIPDQERAYANGDIDVVITYEPAKTRLLELGGQQIFSSADIPGEIVDVFIARQSLILQRQSDFRRFSGGWFRALDYLQKNPDRAAELMAEHMPLTAVQLTSTLSGVRMITLTENRSMLAWADETFVDSFRRIPGLSNRSESTELADYFTDTALPVSVP